MILDRLLMKLVRTPVKEAPTGVEFGPQPAVAPKPGIRLDHTEPAARPHLAAAFAALLVVTALVVAGTRYATTEEQKYARVLAPAIFEQKTWGNAMQQAALATPDLMTLYGGSELKTGGKYDPGRLFEQFPTGFNVFSVGLHGSGSISELQEIAASGEALRGEKVAVVVTPYFFLQPMDPKGWYDYSFSDLNSTALVFSRDLSLEIKRNAAARMLQYPTMLAGDPILRFAMERLTDATPLSDALYYMTYPLAALHLQVLRLQDHWELVNYIHDHPNIKPGIRTAPATLNWDELIQQATDTYAAKTTSNPYGIDDFYWKFNMKDMLKQKNDLTDSKFMQLLEASAEWHDLDLVLKSLQQFGAQTLLLTVPLHGHYYDYRGVSAQARVTFYDMFRAAAKPYGIPVVTFQDHEYDTYFFQDTFDHPSLRGWVFYDRVLDDFYHDRAITQP